MRDELELKLEVGPDASELLRHQPWFERACCRSQRQLSVYFDTPDNALRKEGYTLRVRTTGDEFVQTVKSLGAGAGLFERGEWEHQIDGPQPDLGKLASTPLAHFATEQLQPVISSEIKRTICRLTLADDEVELDIDEGTLAAAGHKAPLHEVEIELIHGQAASAVEVARQIAAEIPVKVGVMSKAERGFALADDEGAKATKAEPVLLRSDMTVAEGFHAVAAACIRHFRLNEPIVIGSRSGEALHQARVAMRRLRSGLTLFRPAIADVEYEQIRNELRSFTAELGDARNLDVLLQRELPASERERLERKRECAYDSAISAMESPRFRLLMLDLVAWTSLGEWRHEPIAATPLEPFLKRRIHRVWKGIARAKRLAAMEDRQRHRLRIRVKRLRYALEFASALHEREHGRQKTFGKALEDVQEALGYFHDIVMARTLLAFQPTEPQGDGEEKRHLRAASRSLRRLHRIGPYWKRASA